MRKNIAILLITSIVLAGSFVAITQIIDLDDDSTLASQPEQAVPAVVEPLLSNPVTARPEPLDTYLTNPGIGWQHFPAVGEQLLPETVVYVHRSDISWNILNPEEGVYDWALLEAYIDQATAQGKQISFRVYTMRDSHRLPQWVIDQGAALLPNGEVDYTSCVYQDAWEQFVEAMRARYDGDPRLAFIDISGYGNYNEWNWSDIQTEWDTDALEPNTLDGHARRRLADMFIGGDQWENHCRLTNGNIDSVRYDYPGFQSTQLLMPFAGIRQSIQYVVSREKNVGIRYDCLGDPQRVDGVLNAIGDEVAQVWPHAPIVYEFCGNTATTPRYMQAAEEMLRITHGSIARDNIADGPRETEPIQAVMQPVGYRYVLTEAIYPAATAAGSTLEMVLRWQNTGYAPSYPRMGQDFALYVGLFDTADTLVLREQAVNANIAAWMPARQLPGNPPTNTIVATLDVPPQLAEGRYSLRVAIIDQRTDRPINLAIAGRDDQGWYVLGTLEVVSPAAG